MFTWIAFYEELASKLIAYRGREKELIEFLESLRRDGMKIVSLEDQDASGNRLLLTTIDPFTVFGVFNRGITQDNRQRILQGFKTYFNVKAPVPTDFQGVPVLNNQSSWFFGYLKDRNSEDIPNLWKVFELALKRAPFEDAAFSRAFDTALKGYGVNINLTMGLFWIQPSVFLSLDSVMRKHCSIVLPKTGLDFASYAKTVDQVKKDHSINFPQLSWEAWKAQQHDQSNRQNSSAKKASQKSDNSEYWMVGAWWDSEDPADQTSRFVNEGIWQNGYDDKYLDEVKQMKVGDRIAIKAATTQKTDLPFDNSGKTISKLIIKATGTIVKNRDDGRTVEVEWDKKKDDRAWYFYTGRATVWHLKKSEDYAQRLIRFTFEGEPQDYDFFLKEWNTSTKAAALDPKAYAIEDAIAEGVFLSKIEIEQILLRLSAKKNLILQGAPGVGKTFIARKLAYALMEARDDNRITSLQFHPSYSYDDFVRGYRPTKDAGRFELVDGPFLAACEHANEDPDRPHVLLIDEINRGNTSHIFGELIMLLEADKRSAKHAVTPLYRRKPEEHLAVPENLYVIGTMNIADRSLALVDYALRRRFAFVTLESKYGATVFDKWLRDRQMSEALRNRIIERMTRLNALIAEDSQLGRHFQIGHSFFCPRGDNFSELGMEWFSEIVETEIVPLLGEYWYDAPEKVASAAAQLRAT